MGLGSHPHRRYYKLVRIRRLLRSVRWKPYLYGERPHAIPIISSSCRVSVLTRPMRSPFIRVLFPCVFAFLLPTLHAGKFYPAQPGEAVAEGQYIVKLKPGIAQSVISTYFPGASINSLRGLNLHLMTLSKGPVANSAATQAALTGMANDAQVEY